MDLNKQVADMMKSLGLSSEAVDEVMQKRQVDFNELAAQAEENGITEMAENPEFSSLMQQMGQLTDQIAVQGGLMPDDIDSLVQQFGGMDNLGGLAQAAGGFGGDLGSLNGLFDKMSEALGIEYDEIDLDEEVAAYDPAAEDAADRKFLAAMKEWIKAAAAEIPEEDVCAFEIGYHTDFADETLETPVYNLWLSYDTDENRAANRARFGMEVWNWINWKGETFSTMPDEPFAAWRETQGYDEDNDGDEMITRIYDLAVAAVMELHSEKFTEQRFGRKVPFVIEDYEYYQQTAIRAVKANGDKSLFGAQFFADCGFTDDET